MRPENERFRDETKNLGTQKKVVFSAADHKRMITVVINGRITEIPDEPEAITVGGLFRKFRGARGIGLEEACRRTGIDLGQLSKTERGLLSMSGRIIERLLRFAYETDVDHKDTQVLERELLALIDPRNPEAEAIKTSLAEFKDEKQKIIEEKRTKATDRQWLQTIASNSFDVGLRCLQVAEGIKVKEFEKEAGQPLGKSKKYTRGGIKPPPYILNRIIDASVLEPSGYAAQCLRLKRVDLTPLSAQELVTCSYGEFSVYARHLRGYSQLDMQKPFGITQPTVNKIEKDALPNPSKYAAKLINFLQLDEESGFASLIRKKARKENHLITQTEIDAALNSSYLFAKHIAELRPYQLSLHDQMVHDYVTDLIAKSVKRIPVGQLLKVVREKQERDEKELAEKILMPLSMLRKIETGTQNTTDLTVVRIANGLGYDIHHPISHVLLQNTVGRQFTYN